MTTGKKTWLISGLLVVVGLPVLGHWCRQRGESGCALDGTKIDPAYRVEIVDDRGRAHAFCCVYCARIWLGHQRRPPQAITVTDEASGDPLDASSAWYVRSEVVTHLATRNRIHVFRSRADAEKHAATQGGTVLVGSDRPFPPAK